LVNVTSTCWAEPEATVTVLVLEILPAVVTRHSNIVGTAETTGGVGVAVGTEVAVGVDAASPADSRRRVSSNSRSKMAMIASS
jgi:hypothetical protein